MTIDSTWSHRSNLLGYPANSYYEIEQWNICIFCIGPQHHPTRDITQSSEIELQHCVYGYGSRPFAAYAFFSDCVNRFTNCDVFSVCGIRSLDCSVEIVSSYGRILCETLSVQSHFHGSQITKPVNADHWFELKALPFISYLHWICKKSKLILPKVAQCTLWTGNSMFIFTCPV